MPRGIRGRKSKANEYSAVNAIVPKERDANGTLVDAGDILPWHGKEVQRSAEEIVRERQEQAAQAAEDAAAAKSALPVEPKKMNAKQRKRLEAAALEKEKEAKRLALYASLAQHQAKPQMLANLGSSSTLGQRPAKRRRVDDEDDPARDETEDHSGDDEADRCTMTG